MRDPEVKMLQEFLNTTLQTDLVEDGAFGKKTRAAVILLQNIHPPLTPDGVVGPKTAAVIELN